MRKMLREHDAGTKRIQEMTKRRTRLMWLMTNYDFKSFNMELRQQEHQIAAGGGTKASSPTHQSQKITVGGSKHLSQATIISSGASAPRSTQARSLA
jgi:hypothetical protein